jgi:hypothetical protein
MHMGFVPTFVGALRCSMSSHSSAAIRVSGWSLRNWRVSMLTVSRTSNGSSSLTVSTGGDMFWGCASCIEMPASCLTGGLTGECGRVRAILPGKSSVAGVAGSDVMMGGVGLIFKPPFGTPPLSSGSLAARKPDMRSGDSASLPPVVACGDEPEMLGLLVTVVRGAGAMTWRGRPWITAVRRRLVSCAAALMLRLVVSYLSQS